MAIWYLIERACFSESSAVADDALRLVPALHGLSSYLSRCSRDPKFGELTAESDVSFV